MTKTQAHNRIFKQFDAGLISETEANRAHQRINQISTGFLNGSRISWNQQKALYSVWAGA